MSISRKKNYVNITDRQTDRQTHQKYSSEPHKMKKKFYSVFFPNFTEEYFQFQ